MVIFSDGGFLIYTRNALAAGVVCVGVGDMRRRGWCALASVVCAGGGVCVGVGDVRWREKNTIKITRNSVLTDFLVFLCQLQAA